MLEAGEAGREAFTRNDELEILGFNLRPSAGEQETQGTRSWAQSACQNEQTAARAKDAGRQAWPNPQGATETMRASPPRVPKLPPNRFEHQMVNGA